MWPEKDSLMDKKTGAMWAPLVLFFAFQFILRVSPGVMAESILGHFGIPATLFGLLTSVYYLGYASMQIPAGLLLDRWGPRYVAGAGAALCGTGAYVFACTDQWMAALGARLIIGLGSACALISVAKLLRSRASDRSFSFFMGISITIGLLGAFAGGKPLTAICTVLGWQKTLSFLALFAWVLALLIIMFVRSRPEAPGDSSFTLAGLRSLYGSARAGGILWIAVSGALLTGPFCAFADVWGVSYFIKVRGWAYGEAANAAVIIYVGMAAGGPILGWLAERYGHPLRLIGIAGMAMLLTFSLMAFCGFSYGITLALGFVLGIFCAFQVLIFTTVLLKAPRAQGGVMMGVVNSINMLSGLVYLPVMGLV